MKDGPFSYADLKEAAGLVEEANRERLRYLTGMDVIVNEYLPKGTIMVMVAPDVKDDLVVLLDNGGK